MATRLLMTSEQAFCFNSCCVARALVIAPLLMAFLLPTFMDFMGGSMMSVSTCQEWDKSEMCHAPALEP